VSFKNDAEALYASVSEKVDPREQLLLEVADKYNLIMNFLSTIDSSKREFMAFIISNTVPNL
jgi:hypothetical protein